MLNQRSLETTPNEVVSSSHKKNKNNEHKHNYEKLNNPDTISIIVHKFYEINNN